MADLGMLFSANKNKLSQASGMRVVSQEWLTQQRHIVCLLDQNQQHQHQKRQDLIYNCSNDPIDQILRNTPAFNGLTNNYIH